METEKHRALVTLASGGRGMWPNRLGFDWRGWSYGPSADGTTWYATRESDEKHGSGATPELAKENALAPKSRRIVVAEPYVRGLAYRQTGERVETLVEYDHGYPGEEVHHVYTEDGEVDIYVGWDESGCWVINDGVTGDVDYVSSRFSDQSARYEDADDTLRREELYADLDRNGVRPEDVLRHVNG
jgi:hypothetical protein